MASEFEDEARVPYEFDNNVVPDEEDDNEEEEGEEDDEDDNDQGGLDREHDIVQLPVARRLSGHQRVPRERPGDALLFPERRDDHVGGPPRNAKRRRPKVDELIFLEGY